MKKKVWKIAWLSISLAVLILVGYLTFEVIVARANTPRIVSETFSSGRVKITADQLTPRQMEILLTVEDPNFYRHHGVDFVTPGAGWTTITQGLAKKFYFLEFKEGFMKIKQTLCAWLVLDPLIDKNTQITLYLNIMYFGNEVFGLEDAAEFYFHKNVSNLNEDEYISLIASLIDPVGLNRKQHPEENALRVRRIKAVLSGEYQPKGLFDITYESAGQ